MCDAEMPDCMKCAHLFREAVDGLTCEAFPDGIPDPILNGDRKHTTPFKGDGGIRFKPFSLTEALTGKVMDGKN